MKFHYPPAAYLLSSSILRQGIVFGVLSFAGFDGSGSYGSISALSFVIGSLSAAVRMLHALSRSRLAQSLAEVDDGHGTPARSIAMIGVVNLVCMMPWGAWFDDAMNYGGKIVTVGTLSLFLVYFSVTAPKAVDAVSGRRRGWCITCLLAAMLLLWPLWNSVYPANPWPGYLMALRCCRVAPARRANRRRQAAIRRNVVLCA
jgi:Amino acid permease